MAVFYSTNRERTIDAKYKLCTVYLCTALNTRLSNVYFYQNDGAGFSTFMTTFEPSLLRFNVTK